MSVELNDPDKVIKYIINKYYYNTSLDRKDLFQIGYVGYLKAVNNSKPEYDSMALSYATYYIRQEINLALKKENTYVFNKSFQYNEEKDIRQTDNEDSVDIEFIKQGIDKLNVKDKYVLNMLYTSSHTITMAELGDILGVSKQRISQIAKEAINRLKDLIGE